MKKCFLKKARCLLSNYFHQFEASQASSKSPAQQEYSLKFIPSEINDSDFRTVGQVNWNSPSQRVTTKKKILQSEQMTNFLWNISI